MVMLLQGDGLRSVLKRDGIISSSLTSANSCQIEVQEGQKMGIRLQVNQNQIVSFVEDGDDVQYKRC
jgi:hypothetical protein